jgi:hypothetical protein
VAKRGARVPRPIKSAEYTIVLATSQAQKGWTDVVATQRNSVAEAWDRLTKEPLRSDQRCHQLKGDLATFTHNGATPARRQYELNAGARIWFYVEAQTVHVVHVFTAHPNQTK